MIGSWIAFVGGCVYIFPLYRPIPSWFFNSFAMAVLVGVLYGFFAQIARLRIKISDGSARQMEILWVYFGNWISILIISIILFYVHKF